jgi:hypothetical protein
MKKVVNMEARTYIFKSISDIISFGLDQKDFLFRGHTQLVGDLVPKVFRGDYENFKDFSSGFNPEVFFYSNFKRLAPSRITTIPPSDNNLEWLCLMQHHKLPTRLLDWTQNILIALYFAAYDNFDTDGELFALDPYALNRHYMLKFPDNDNDVLRSIANQPFIAKSKSRKEYQFPLAFLPVLSHPRITAQKSAFTIHPNLKHKRNLSLVEILKRDDELFRIKIPHEKKRDILAKLNNLGINHSVIFPDLEGLAVSLTYGYEYFGIGTYRPVIDNFRLSEAQ